MFQILFLNLNELRVNFFRNFDDFLITLDAQEEKFDALRRLTLLEKAYSQQRKKEAERFFYF